MRKRGFVPFEEPTDQIVLLKYRVLQQVVPQLLAPFSQRLHQVGHDGFSQHSPDLFYTRQDASVGYRAARRAAVRSAHCEIRPGENVTLQYLSHDGSPGPRRASRRHRAAGRHRTFANGKNPAA